MASKNQSNGARLGFENKLWEMADSLRGHMDAAEYKHVVLGLILLKYISDTFQNKYDEMVHAHRERLARERKKGEYAFAARRRATRRIGLPRVRNHRLNILDRSTFPRARQARRPDSAVNGAPASRPRGGKLWMVNDRH